MKNLMPRIAGFCGCRRGENVRWKKKQQTNKNNKNNNNNTGTTETTNLSRL